MDYIKEYWFLIMFFISLIGMLIKQRVNETRLKMRIVEVEKDIKIIEKKIEKDNETIQKMFSIISVIKAEQTIEFKYIKETLARHHKEIS